MVLKDAVVGWYIKQFVIPRAQVLDTPGYLVFKIYGKSSIFSRQTILPESFFVLLEKQAISKFGDTGKQALYSAGKKFGYRFAEVANVMSRKDMPKKQFLDYVDTVLRFIEGTYGSKVTYEIDYEKSIMEFHLKNWIVCNKSGEGYFFTSGGGTGIWSKLIEDHKIEGVQLQCQGQGFEECVLVCASPEYLKKYNKPVYIETNLDGLKLTPEYAQLNSIRHTQSSNYSFRQYLDTGLFKYSDGKITDNKGERYFFVEASCTQLLEQEFDKQPELKELLYNCAFETGKTLLPKGVPPTTQTIADILTAFGFGDILILKKQEKLEVIAQSFPWTEFTKNSDLLVFKGFLAGLFSDILHRKVFFKTKKSFEDGQFNVFLSEE